MKIYLASVSPRRRQLLAKMGVDFKIVAPRYQEKIIEGLNPEEYVKQNAIEKAKSVLDEIREGVVIAADTVVVVNGEILEKPRDEKAAFSMLKKLSGAIHFVYTAIAVVNVQTNQREVRVEVTEVEMRDLTDQEIEKYIESGEPMDAAGAYKIQENAAKFIKRINGSYNNIIGLPLITLREILKRFQVDVVWK
ncbi:MAG: Maf family protein [Candidatus Helarchaeota archaeon]